MEKQITQKTIKIIIIMLTMRNSYQDNLLLPYKKKNNCSYKKNKNKNYDI